MSFRSGFRFIAMPVVCTAMALSAMANVMLFFPGPLGEPAGVPAYARIERAPDGSPLVHHDNEWAAIPFYRDPACLLDSTTYTVFNLLDFLDAPRSFSCPMTVEGFEIWKNGPWAGDVSPLQTVSYGTGNVPVWFVRWEVLQAALIDNTLTMSELVGLSPLKGRASFFKETLHPLDGAQRTKTQIVARGLLEDGRTFNFQSEETDSHIKTVTIQFR